MSVLLPTLVLVGTTAVLLAKRIWKTWKHPRNQARGFQCSRAAPVEIPPQGPAAPGSRLYIPCGCSPGCTPCATAAQELQDLVTSLWPGMSFPQDSEMWRLSWEDLEQLLERGHLPCCTSSCSSGNLQPFRSRCPRFSIRRKPPVIGKGSVLRRTRRWLRSSTLPRMSIPWKGSSIPAQTLCNLCCAPAGTWALPAKKQVETSCSHQCPIHGSQDPAVEPSQKTLHMLLDKRLQRQRQLFSCPGCSLELAVKEKAKEDLQTLAISSKDLHPCQSLHEIGWTPDGGAHMDRSPCCLGAMGIHRTHKKPTAKQIQPGAWAILAKCPQERVVKQEVSWSYWCPVHGSQDTAAVPQDKTLRAALDKKLQREMAHPIFQGVLGRWLSRVRMQLMAAASKLHSFLCAK